MRGTHHGPIQDKEGDTGDQQCPYFCPQLDPLSDFLEKSVAIAQDLLDDAKILCTERPEYFRFMCCRVCHGNPQSGMDTVGRNFGVWWEGLATHRTQQNSSRLPLADARKNDEDHRKKPEDPPPDEGKAPPAEVQEWDNQCRTSYKPETGPDQQLRPGKG
jgi:hypothetical protein